MATIQFDPIGKFKYTKNDMNQYHSYNDEPAIEYLDGSAKIWYKNGLIHREDKPAIIKLTMTPESKYKTEEEYYFEGRLHNYKISMNDYSSNQKYYKGTQLIVDITERGKIAYSYQYKVCSDCKTFKANDLRNLISIDKSNIYCFKCQKLTYFTKIEMLMYQINSNSEKSFISSFISKYKKKDIKLKSFNLKDDKVGNEIIIFGLSNKFYFHKINKGDGHRMKGGITVDNKNILISIDSLQEITNLEDLITYEEEIDLLTETTNLEDLTTFSKETYVNPDPTPEPTVRTRHEARREAINLTRLEAINNALNKYKKN